MVFCGVCKENREVKNRWMIHEHAVDSSVLRDFKICDECAASVIRKIVAEMNRSKEKSEEIKSIVLNRIGLIDSVTLAEDDVLEITLSMDLAKARKIVLNETEE